MSNFAIDGLISGFDTESLINAMLDIQVRAPVNQLERRIETETEKLGALQSVNANLLGVDIAATSLSSPSLFNGREATSSNENVVSVSASSSAPLGSFSVQVNNLAKAAQISSENFIDPNDELGESGQFIINGKTVTVDSGDSLNTIAAKITSLNSGAKATVIKTAANQNKLVINATEAGTDKLELREVGSSNILANLGLINENTSFDFTVNANQNGAMSSAFASGDTVTFNNQTFGVTDAGGQQTVEVTLDGTLTLQQIADEINSASAAQNGLIEASVITTPEGERLIIGSETGIPTKFEDSDNALFALGITSGVQSEDFSSASKPIGGLLGLTSAEAGDVTLQAGDGSGEITINVDFANDSLQDIADKINNAAGGSPPSTLSAQVITAGNTSRLELASASGHPIVVSDAKNILQTLGIADRELAQIDQRGENSQFRFNGVTVNRDSNVIDDLVEGVTIALGRESPTTETVNIREDFANVGQLISDFVDAFNKSHSNIEELSLFDPQGGNHGILFGNSTVRNLQSSLNSALAQTVPNLPVEQLSELNNGQGVAPGKIAITDRAGNTAEIDLTGAETVQDVLDEINLNNSIQVRAEVSSTGLGINLIDQSGGGGALQVENVDSGTTASDLGLDKRVFSDQITGSAISRGGSTPLSSIGIEVNKGGSLSFDQSKLDKMLRENPDLVKNLLTAANVGFVKNFRETLSFFTAFGTGALDATTKTIQEKIEGFKEQIDRIETRALSRRQTLQRQFTNLETTLSQSQQLGQFLTQQLNGN